MYYIKMLDTFVCLATSISTQPAITFLFNRVIQQLPNMEIGLHVLPAWLLPSNSLGFAYGMVLRIK